MGQDRVKMVLAYMTHDTLAPGYGDASPKTFLGRLGGSFVMLVGLLIIAVPITVIGNNFSEVCSSYNHPNA